MNARLTVLATDRTCNLTAFVVVDSIVEGRAMGGTRMTPGVTVDEVADLASRMTQKLALAGVPIGGAKAGIVCDLPAGVERDRVLADFGETVAPLLHGGVYLGSDQGVSHRDRDLFFRTAGYDVLTEPRLAGLPCDWATLWHHCADVTGHGLCQAIFAAVEHGLACGPRPSVVIQGFGSVGGGVAALLDRAGWRVVAVADRHGTVSAAGGLPITELLAVTDAQGAIDRRRLPVGLCSDPAPDAWLRVPADVLVLAAGGNAISAERADQVRASLVVEGGNLACAPAAQLVLARRGITVLPDFVVNVGGAAVTGMLLTGQAPVSAGTEELVDWLYAEVGARIRRNVNAMLLRCGEGATPAQAAAELVPVAVA
ncbi:MAG: Glu/Leu/Phe/Val dehydrogenase dimerization domain-containing protein [Jatrophihabitantaceae bacterium]